MRAGTEYLFIRTVTWAYRSTRLERLGRKGREEWLLGGEVFPDRAGAGPDPPGIVGFVPGVDHSVELV
jgi:hypothetical protein